MKGFETTLTPDPTGDGYRLNGEKFYSTGSLYSDWTQVYASTPEGTVAAATIPVDREGVSILDDWDGFGQRLTGTGTTHARRRPGRARGGGRLRPPRGPGRGARHPRRLPPALPPGGDGRRAARGPQRRGRPGPPPAPLLQPLGRREPRRRSADPPGGRRDRRRRLRRRGDRPRRRRADRGRGATRSSTASPTPSSPKPPRSPPPRRRSRSTPSPPAPRPRLFDAGGASATQAAANLDRHWRNIRTISTHNPTFSKASAVGDFLVNGTPPPRNGFF